jgi:hypothetical protein
MKDLINKFAELEREISAEKGDFTLFGVFLREDAPDLWDVVIAASWFGEDKREDLKYIIGEINKKLTNEDRTKLSRVVLLDNKDGFVQNITSVLGAEHTITEFVGCVFNNVFIKHGYIITSRRAI